MESISQLNSIDLHCKFIWVWVEISFYDIKNERAKNQILVYSNQMYLIKLLITNIIFSCNIEWYGISKFQLHYHSIFFYIDLISFILYFYINKFINIYSEQIHQLCFESRLNSEISKKHLKIEWYRLHKSYRSRIKIKLIISKFVFCWI